MTAELIKRAEQRLLIPLVYTQIWHSFAFIKPAADMQTSASCGSKFPGAELLVSTSVLVFGFVLLCLFFFCLSHSLLLPHTSPVLPEGSSDLAKKKSAMLSSFNHRERKQGLRVRIPRRLVWISGTCVRDESGSLCSWGPTSSPPTPHYHHHHRSASLLSGKGLRIPPYTLQPPLLPVWTLQRQRKVYETDPKEEPPVSVKELQMGLISDSEAFLLGLVMVPGWTDQNL